MILKFYRINMQKNRVENQRGKREVGIMGIMGITASRACSGDFGDDGVLGDLGDDRL